MPATDRSPAVTAALSSPGGPCQDEMGGAVVGSEQAERPTSIGSALRRSSVPIATTNELPANGAAASGRSGWIVPVGGGGGPR